MRSERLLLAAGLLMATGCYSYVPTRLESVQPGDPVRITVSLEEVERLEAVRLTSSREIDGTVVRSDGNTLLIDTPVGRLDPLTGGRSFMQRLDVPVGEIRDIEQRKRDNIRTALAIGSLAVASGVVIYTTLEGGFGSQNPPGEAPQEDRRFPLFLRFNLPF